MSANDMPDTEAPSTAPPKRRQGFAVMDPKRRSEIARKGARAAHEAGTAHEFTRDEARAAGSRGGHVMRARRASAKTEPK